VSTRNWELIGVLKRLFETCRDSETGFRLAAERVKEAEWKALFQGYAEQRGQFAAELQGELGRLGAHDGKTGTIAEAFHQGWTGIEAAVTGGSDQAVMAECERGENVARKHFQQALQHDLPADVQALVRRQLAAVQEAHDRIRGLERAAK
jgi:uncharacterized protein (TIGR02284 family)